MTKLKEEVPTVSAGSGAIAGIGVGPDGEPGVDMTQRRKKWKKDEQQSTPIEMVSDKRTMEEMFDELKSIDEDLRDWFGKGKTGGVGGGGWDRYNTKGERIGKCGDAEDRGGDGEGKPKCLSKEKATQLRTQGGTKAIANAVKRKKDQDSVTNRKGTGGTPRPVSNRIGEASLQEKNVPTNPELWSRAKSEAKKRFDVYPSAYANGWASKWYKKRGGGWRSKSNEAVVKTESNTPTDREFATDSLTQIYKKDTPGQTTHTEVVVTVPHNQTEEFMKDLLSELVAISEAWQKITTCQQCKRPLSPREQKLGFRICDKCVTKNKSGIWGNDSDDEYEEQIEITKADPSLHEAECACTECQEKTALGEGLPVTRKQISRVVVDYMHGRDGGSLSQTRLVLVASNLARPQARSESSVMAFLKKKHPKEEIIILNLDFLDSTGKPINEAEYQGRAVTLNKPFRTPDGPKKFSVYVRNDKDNIVKVSFGDPDMEIKRDDPDRRSNYRARHGCDNPGPKWKANYWSCRMWAGKSVSDVISEDKMSSVLIALPKPSIHSDGRGFWKIDNDVYRASVNGGKDVYGAPLDKRWESSYNHFVQYWDSVHAKHYVKTKDWIK